MWIKLVSNVTYKQGLTNNTKKQKTGKYWGKIGGKKRYTKTAVFQSNTTLFISLAFTPTKDYSSKRVKSFKFLFTTVYNLTVCKTVSVETLTQHSIYDKKERVEIYARGLTVLKRNETKLNRTKPNKTKRLRWNRN